MSLVISSRKRSNKNHFLSFIFSLGEVGFDLWSVLWQRGGCSYGKKEAGSEAVKVFLPLLRVVKPSGSKCLMNGGWSNCY